MKPRTPGFTPGRLTLARDAGGLNKAELASLVGKTSAAIGTYETGIRTPGPDTLLRLAEVLGHPVEFFTRPEPPSRAAHAAVFYRSRRSAERLARMRAQARMVYLWDALDYFETFVELPPVNLPQIGQLPDRLEDITDTIIDGVAHNARQHWKLADQPVPNLVWLLEGSGIIVVRLDLNTDRLEALSEWREAQGRPYIILNSTKKNAFRSRVDAAHELGHLLLHRSVTREQLEDDETFKIIEAQAWRFAQAFLLPTAPFMRDVYSLNLDALLALKPKWGVSVAFMLHRIHKMGVLTPDKYTNYRKYLAGRDWLQWEPYDRETAPEKPYLLRQLIEHFIGQDIQTVDQINRALYFPSADLDDLMQMQPGYFTPRPSYTIPFTSKQRAG